MNYQIISANIFFARDELENIAEKLSSEDLTETEFRNMLQHVHYHLNLAWNTRHVSTNKYNERSEKDREKWGQYPSGIENG